MGVQETRENLELANQHTGYAHEALGRIANQADVHQGTSEAIASKAEEIGPLVGQIIGLLGDVQGDISEIRGNAVVLGTMIDTLPASEVEALINARERIDSDTGIVARNYIDPGVEKAQGGVGFETTIKNLRGGLVIAGVGKSALRLLRSAMDLTERAISKL